MTLRITWGQQYRSKPDYQLMEGDLAIIPAPGGFGSYVELGATPGATGRVFRKHILNLGPLHYKGRTFNLDDGWYSQLEKNFTSGVSMTQVPLAGSRNEHSEDPMRNTGEIIGLQREGNKVYDVIDVRDPDVAQRLSDGRINGASAFLHMDYTDTRSDTKVGPAILHHCLTNRPHVLDLEPYQEIVAATADMAGVAVPAVRSSPSSRIAAMRRPLSCPERVSWPRSSVASCCLPGQGSPGDR